MLNECGDISAIVVEINELYTKYHSLSNDELREYICEIELAVKNTADKDPMLELKLPQVYALVKETARRFSLGEVVVTANDYDRKLAENYDFIHIEGENAVYHNRWFAGGNRFEWKMVHYDEQIFGGILLHKGYVTEMATGEGKTLMATLPVFLNALTHRGVHVMTVNDYLSQRDYELTRPIYMFHGLSVGCIENSQHVSLKRKAAYDSDITFGTNSSFTFDYLYDHLSVSPELCVQRNHNFAVIDELDSILIDEADNPHIIGGGNLYNVGQDYKDKKIIIEELLATTHTPLFEVDSLKKKAWFTEEGKKWLSMKCQIENLFDVGTKYHEDIIDQYSKQDLQIDSENCHIQNVFYQLLNAYTLYKLDVDYVVHGGNVIIVDHHTGRLKESYRWEHGLHTAVEVKENVSPKDDHDGLAVISLKNYFKLYTKICGMTGTVMSVAEELRSNYNLNTMSIPTHRPLIRKDLPLQIYRTNMEKDSAIIRLIENIHEMGRPILIGCQSIKRAEELSIRLNERNVVHNLLTAKSLDKEAYIISQAGIEKTITVSTSLAGRGTDIKLTEESLRLGGLAVIGTDLLSSSRIDKQLKGRAGRQGDPGSSIFFVSLEDLIVKNLSEEDRARLYHTVADIDSVDISVEAVRNYVQKAQSICEEYYFEQRKNSIRKDDIVAPYRYRFYQQRNKILFDASSVNDILKDIIVDGPESIDIHIHKLYQTAKAIFSRSYANNKVRTKIRLPFSENRDLFTLVFEIDRVINNFEYFKSEYIRQIILGSYDKYWKRFVQHLMSDLDTTEIDRLPMVFELMKGKMDSLIFARLKYSVIPVGDDALEVQKHGEKEQIQNKKPMKKEDRIRSTISLNDICPCGSGKNYYECHGSNIRNIKPNRRR